MAAQPDLVIGIDSSTSGCKAIVWDRQGNPLAEGRASLPLEKPRPNWHEQAAEAWWDSTCLALRQAVQGIEPRRLAALAISHQRETFVPLDGHGRPLRNAILWMDGRSGPLLPELAARLGAERLHQLTGKPLSRNLSLGKIYWLQVEEPEVFAQTARFADVQAYLVQRLTGEYRTGWGSADPTGLFDLTDNRWSAELLAKLNLRQEQFAEAFPPGAVLGRVTPAAARECSLPAGLPVVSGLGDGQSAGLGLNVTGPGEAYLSLGTSVISGTFSDKYRASPAFRTMTGGIAGSYLLETVLLGGTYTIDWFQEFLAGKPGISLAEMEAAARWLAPGSAGLLLVPYWNSAMNPYWDTAASGIIVGWRGIHQPPHLYRAILEGIAFELRLQLSGVEMALGRPLERLVASGGGARSDLWLEIIAAVSGRPVYRSRTTEAAALGAGILAAAGAGLFADVRQAAQAMTHIEPQPFLPDQTQTATYTRLYEDVYRHIFPAIRPYLDRLTELAQG